MNEARIKANYDFLVANKLVEPGKMKIEEAFKLDAVKAAKVLP